MILSFLFFAFIAYLVFKLVVDFVIPIYKTTKKVKRSFREMHQKMHQQANGTTANQQANKPFTTTTTKKEPSGDYIDFEEVKD